MGAMKNYYATIAYSFTDEELRKLGWSDERIAWLRYCFGGK